MPLFPSDFKKFKHVKTDDKTTTLEHPNGHQITIVHSALKGPLKEQLLAMGGAVEKAKKEGLLGTQPKVTQEIEEGDEKYKGMQEYHGDAKVDVRTPEQKERAKDAAKKYGYAEGGEVESETAQLDPDMLRKREIYNNLVQSGTVLPMTEMPTTPDMKMFGPQGEEPQNFSPAVAGQAEQMFQKEKADNAAKVAGEQQATIADNSARVSMGLPPTQVPQVPTGPQPSISPDAQTAPTIAPTEAPTPAKAEATPTLSGSYGKMMQGIQAEAKAREGLAQEQTGILQAAQESQAKLQEQYQQEFDDLNMERQNVIHDIQNGHIDPERFWDNHSKVASAIGIILAGFNPTNSPNAAVNFLKFQMEQNLDAQKKNLGAKENLLSANLRQFGNMKDAMDMTRVMQADVAKSQLEIAAAKATSPLAKAAAMKAAAELEGQYAPLFQKVATQQAISKLMQGTEADPSRIPQILDMMESTDPEKAKALRGRFIPDVGFAQVEKDATDLKEMRGGMLEARSGLEKLLKLTNRPLKSLSTDDRAEASTIQQTLVGALRLPITGPGAMNEGEREMLQKIIANPTSMFTLDSSTKVRLKTLMSTLDDKFAAAAKARGVNYKSESAKKQDQQNTYVEWAKKNPNNPKAKLILERQGK